MAVSALDALVEGIPAYEDFRKHAKFVAEVADFG